MLQYNLLFWRVITKIVSNSSPNAPATIPDCGSPSEIHPGWGSSTHWETVSLSSRLQSQMESLLIFEFSTSFGKALDVAWLGLVRAFRK